MKNILSLILVMLLVIATAQATSQRPATELQQQQQQQPQRQHAHPHRKHNHHQQQQHQQRRRLENHEKRERLPKSALPSVHPDQEVESLVTAKPAAHQKQQQLQQQQHHHQQQHPNRRNATTSTRLRRISTRDFYNNNNNNNNNNKVPPRRLNNRNGQSNGGPSEWSYNSYNIHTNTYGGPSGAAGKGDDNTHDVEFIGSSPSQHEWSASPKAAPTAAPPPPHRGYGYVPPLVPASATAMPPSPSQRPAVTAATPTRRSYAAVTPTTPTSTVEAATTENPFDGNSIGRNDPKDMERRHICMQQRTIQMPVKTTEVYTRPIWKHVSTPCQPQTHVNQMCTRVQLMHEPAYRDVIRHKSAQQVTYDCCTGWMRETPHADACMKPICATRCQNGGSCAGPDECSCPSGYTGRYCEHDINECKVEKPCDQSCINTVGSYYCKCREGFVLQADQQSCKKIDLHDDDAFEARDLENEIETNEDVAARLQKIERSLANERVQTHQLEKSLQSTYHVVDSLKSRLSTLEKQHMDLTRLQSNFYAAETRTNKLEGMLNMLMKCRNGPNAYCP